jgi:hypothetical protein
VPGRAGDHHQWQALHIGLGNAVDGVQGAHAVGETPRRGLTAQGVPRAVRVMLYSWDMVRKVRPGVPSISTKAAS